MIKEVWNTIKWNHFPAIYEKGLFVYLNSGEFSRPSFRN